MQGGDWGQAYWGSGGAVKLRPRSHTIRTPLIAIAAGSFAVFALTKIDSVWVIVAAALLGLVGAAVTG